MISSVSMGWMNPTRPEHGILVNRIGDQVLTIGVLLLVQSGRRRRGSLREAGTEMEASGKWMAEDAVQVWDISAELESTIALKPQTSHQYPLPGR